MGIDVDKRINNIENYLSEIAAYPVAGIFAGTAKMIMGVVQLITAIACGILTFIPAAASRDWSPLCHSWNHIKHGLGNITAGFFEAIPLVGTAIYLLRQLNKNYYPPSIQAYFYTGHDNKCMPYTSLIKADCGIDGIDDGNLTKHQRDFALALNKKGGRQNFSIEALEALANTIIDANNNPQMA
jgi:hypothetical protein